MAASEEKRSRDRRKRQKRFYGFDRRQGPRRLTCECGGLIRMEMKSGRGRDWIVFSCLRCSKKETRYLGATQT